MHSCLLLRYTLKLLSLTLFTGIIQILTVLGYYLPELLIIASGPIWLLPEPLSGSLMISLLYILYTVAGFAVASHSTLSLLVIGVLCTFVPFLVQLLVGHRLVTIRLCLTLTRVFEKDARDDTNKNVKEFKKTGNFIPLVLVFYYHVVCSRKLYEFLLPQVEVVLMTGYQPDLKKEIERFTEQEKKSEYYKSFGKIQLD